MCGSANFSSAMTDLDLKLFFCMCKACCVSIGFARQLSVVVAGKIVLHAIGFARQLSLHTLVEFHLLLTDGAASKACSAKANVP